MILIKYTDTTIEVTGHANFAKKGNDIVCAAVSAIIMGAINWFQAKDIEVKENKKKGQITIVIKNRKPENMLMLDLVVQQLKPIAKKFKKYVKIKKGR